MKIARWMVTVTPCTVIIDIRLINLSYEPLQWKNLNCWTRKIEMIEKAFRYLEPPKNFRAAVRKQTQGDSGPKIWIQYHLTFLKISNMLLTPLIDCGAIISVIRESTLASIDSSFGCLTYQPPP